MLKTALQARTILNTPIICYVQKLANKTERLNTRDIICQRETNNLWAIAKKRTERKKGKRAVLKGQFHISTEELRAAVIAAEKETVKAKKKLGKGKGKQASCETESEAEGKEDIGDEINSDIEDCIIVNSMK